MADVFPTETSSQPLGTLSPCVPPSCPASSYQRWRHPNAGLPLHKCCSLQVALRCSVSFRDSPCKAVCLSVTGHKGRVARSGVWVVLLGACGSVSPLEKSQGEMGVDSQSEGSRPEQGVGRSSEPGKSQATPTARKT